MKIRRHHNKHQIYSSKQSDDNSNPHNARCCSNNNKTKNNQANNYSKDNDTIGHIIYASVFVSLSLTLISAFFLSQPYSHAEQTCTTNNGVTSCTDSVNASVTVPATCTLSTTGGGSYSASLMPGASTELTGSPLNVSCNDVGGYSLYAIGYSGDSYTDNNTKMLASAGASYNISTATSGSDSYWAMKVAGSGTNTPIIDNSFSSYQQIPATYTKVSHTTSNTANSVTTPTYKVSLSSTQVAGSYTGKVKYTIVHPNTADAPTPPPYMQDATFADCGKTMVDSRDGQEYTTAVLADGKCWMTTNLNLTGGTALSSDDTDVTSDYISSFSTSNSLTKTGDTIVLPASSTSGFNTANYSYVYNTINRSGPSYCSSDPGCYSYYSWDAATLGSGRSISTNNTDAPHSICPKGWRLPTSRTTSATNWQTTSDFYALAHQYGLDSTTSTSESDNGFYTQAGPSTIPNFLLAGYYYNGSFYYGGSDGLYWSSTSYSNTSDARRLYLSSSYVRSANSGGRGYGFSVRCLKDKPTMQSVTSSDLASMLPNTGDTTTLKDERDGKEYTIAKLTDGKYWMTTNLDLAGGTALDADTTDITSDYISSFSTSNNLTKTGNTIVLPASSTSGFNANNYSYVYNTTNRSDPSYCSSDPGCYSYYSWDAATLGSGRSISTNNTDAPHSICPKGWKLPSTYDGTDSSTDFRALMIALGGSSTVQTYTSSTSPIGATMYSNLIASPNNFLLAGLYYNGSFFNGGSYGGYWSSTSSSSTSNARDLYFSSSSVNSANSVGRNYGFSVRCLKKSE